MHRRIAPEQKIISKMRAIQRRLKSWILEYQGCVWVGDPCLQLDRWKAAKAARELWELGIISKKTLTQMLTGHNYEGVVAQRAREKILEPETVKARETTEEERKALEDDKNS